MAVNKVILKSGKVLMDTSEVTVTPWTLQKGRTALDAEGNLIVGEMELGEIKEVEQAVPVIEVSSAGLITASATQAAGAVAAGTKSATKQLTTQTAKTVTPTTSEQTAVVAGVYTTGVVKVAAMPTATQATPSITVDSAGKITASATQSAGYVTAGTKSATKQLTAQSAKTVTPTTSNQTVVASGVYTTGAVTVKGDANLKAENIAQGVSIFGVLGAFAGGGMSEFGGYPCEVGTCIMTKGSCTIPHSLGTLKGAILMSQGKYGGYTLVIVTLENTFSVELYSDGSGGDAMNSSMSSKNFWITANNTNSATIKLDMYFADAQNMNYILLGA